MAKSKKKRSAGPKKNKSNLIKWLKILKKNEEVLKNLKN